jgi:Tfp pilus assembly pilus retraction ATPase PilT
MATILVDRLLQAAKLGANDMHLAVDQLPVCRIRGRMRTLDTEVLQPLRHRGNVGMLLRQIRPFAGGPQSRME